jgi:Holliday junction resolvase
MTHPSKRKGNKFERDLVKHATDSGIKAERAYASNGRALGCHESVDVLIGDWKVQAKIRKALPEYLQIPDGCDCVAFRQDHGEPLVLITLWKLLDIIKGCEEND